MATTRRTRSTPVQQDLSTPGAQNSTPTIRFGCMGWAYDDWKGPFYSQGVRNERMLDELSRVLDAVEIDASFYGAPRSSTLTHWASQVPTSFRFCAKTPRSITHERRLVRASEEALSFAALLRETLGEKLGHILLQLPPDFTADDYETVLRFLDETAGAAPWAMELRDVSWADTDIVEKLDASGVVSVVTEKLDLGAPLRYVRLLGEEGSVARFDERQFDRGAELDVWATRLQQAPAGADIFVFVRNLFEGHAPATIAELRRRLNLPHPIPPGQQQMSLF